MPHEQLPPEEDRVSINEAARLLGVHHSTARRLIAKRKLGAWRVGGRYVLSRREVLAFPERTGPGQPAKGGAATPAHTMTEAEAHRFLIENGYYK